MASSAPQNCNKPLEKKMVTLQYFNFLVFTFIQNILSLLKNIPLQEKIDEKQSINRIEISADSYILYHLQKP